MENDKLEGPSSKPDDGGNNSSNNNENNYSNWDMDGGGD